jgi:hypothetical protein
MYQAQKSLVNIIMTLYIRFHIIQSKERLAQLIRGQGGKNVLPLAENSIPRKIIRKSGINLPLFSTVPPSNSQ